MKRALLALFLAGCGAPLETECALSPFASVTSTDPVSCERVAKNYALAERLLSAVGVVTGELEGWELLIDAPKCVSVITSECASGFTSNPAQGTKEIWVTHSTSALAHELIHAVQYQQGIPTSGHVGWAEKGYFEADQDYVAHADLGWGE